MQTPFNAVGKIGMCAKCTSPWLRFKKRGDLVASKQAPKPSSPVTFEFENHVVVPKFRVTI